MGGGVKISAKCGYCMSKKSWPILYSNLINKMGHYFLDIQYINLFFSERVDSRIRDPAHGHSGGGLLRKAEWNSMILLDKFNACYFYVFLIIKSGRQTTPPPKKIKMKTNL